MLISPVMTERILGPRLTVANGEKTLSPVK